MNKKEELEKDFTIVTEHGKVLLFESNNYEDDSFDLPDKVFSLTPIQIKFSTPGQHVTGQYCGCQTAESSYKEGESYHFHEIMLSDNRRVGFIGSSQLDRSLSKLEPYKFDVHIIYVEERELPGKRKFKRFAIFVREHVHLPQLISDKDAEPEFF